MSTLGWCKGFETRQRRFELSSSSFLGKVTFDFSCRHFCKFGFLERLSQGRGRPNLPFLVSFGLETPTPRIISLPIMLGDPSRPFTSMSGDGDERGNRQSRRTKRPFQLLCVVGGGGSRHRAPFLPVSPLPELQEQQSPSHPCGPFTNQSLSFLDSVRRYPFFCSWRVKLENKRPSSDLFFIGILN
jgi:hypothetical protein